MLRAVSQQDASQIPKLVEGLFGRESKAAVSGLVNNMDKFRSTMELAKESSRFAGSSEKEYQRELEKTSVKMQQARANMEVMMIRLGATLIPVFNRFLSAVEPVVSAVGAFVDKFPGVSSVVMVGIAVVGGLGLALGPVLTGVAASAVGGRGSRRGKLSKLGKMGVVGGVAGLAMSNIGSISTLMDDDAGSKAKAAGVGWLSYWRCCWWCSWLCYPWSRDSGGAMLGGWLVSFLVNILPVMIIL